MPNPISMIDDIGVPQVVDESQIESALAQGWRIEAPEEMQARQDAERYGSAEQQALGGIEAGLRGATFGLSDLALNRAIAAIRDEEFAKRDAAEAEARRRELGGVGTALEFAGAALPALATGGTGAVARGLAATPAGLASRVGLAAEGLAARALPSTLAEGSLLGRSLGAGVRLGVGGGVEGALIGGGMGISEATLAGKGGDYGALGEAWLTGAEGGALGGALFGGALGMGGGALAGLTSKAGKRFAPALEGFARDRAIKSTNAMPGQIKAVWKDGADARMAGAADEMMDSGILGGLRKAEDMAPRARAHAVEAGKELGAFRERVYSAIDDAADAAASGGAGYRGSAKPLVDVTEEARAFLRQVDDTIIAPARKGIGTKTERRLIRSLEDDLADFRSRLTPDAEGAVAGVTMREMVDFRKKLDDIIRPPKAPGQIATAAPHVGLVKEARKLLEKRIEDITDTVAEKIDPTLAGQYKKLKQSYGRSRDINKLIESGQMRDMANRWASPSDYGTGLGVVAGLIGSGGAILPALAKGAALSMLHKVLRERGSSTLAVTAYRMARHEQVLSDSLKKYLTAGTRREAAIEGARPPKRLPAPRPRVPIPAIVFATQKGETDNDAYRRRLRDLREMDPINDPGTGRAAVEAPNTTTAAVGSLARARQYLLDNAPTDPLDGDPLQPHLKPSNANPVELQKYARKWAAVDDPLGTIERGLATGQLTREEVEAIRTVYPVTWEDIRQKVFDQLAESKDRLPYEKRIRLGILFDLPTDKSLRPDQIARTQALYRVTLPGERAAQGPPQPAAAPQQLARSHATPAQAIEGGMQEF